MRYLSLFCLVFFLSYTSVFALPLLGVIPFVFEIGILLYTFGAILISGGIFYILKYRGIFSWIFLCIALGCMLGIYIWIGKIQWELINLQTPLGVIDYQHVVYGLLVCVILGTVLHVYKKISAGVLYSAFIIIIIHVPLLISVYELDHKLSHTMNEVEKISDDRVDLISRKILNNIFVSQDFRYSLNGNTYECRLTLSRYKRTGTQAPYAQVAEKTKDFQLYTGLDSAACRKLLSSILY